MTTEDAEALKQRALLEALSRVSEDSVQKDAPVPQQVNRAQRRRQEAHMRKRSSQEDSRRTVTKAMKVHLPMLVDGVHATLSESIAEQVSHAPQKPSCKKGCAACCEQLVLITTGEAMTILKHYPALVSERLSTLQDLAVVAAEVFEGQSINPSTEEGAAALSAVSELYWERRTPCAFLDHDKSECRIYEHRPISCRSHMVVSDPDLCAKREDPETGVSAPVMIMPAFARQQAYEQLQQHETKFLSQMSLGPMSSVLLMTRANLKKWA